MSFPASPADGQQSVFGNVTYQFNATKSAWIRVPGVLGNIAVISVTATGNVSAGAYYWANGTPFASSTYANSNVTAYLPTDPIITSLQANAATQSTEISSLRANVTAANAAIVTANTGMKSYVDNQVISSGGYSNVALAAYLATNDITVANITGGGVRTTSSATAPANPSVGDIWYSTTEDRIYRYTSDGTTKAWLDITGSTYTFDMTGEMAITGNIVPTVNAAYNIGSSAYRFKDVYISGNTATGNILSTGYYFANGAPFVSSNYSNVNVAAYLAGNVTAGNVQSTGYYFANGAPFSSGGGTSTSAYMLSYIFGA